MKFHASVAVLLLFAVQTGNVIARDTGSSCKVSLLEFNQALLEVRNTLSDLRQGSLEGGERLRDGLENADKQFKSLDGETRLGMESEWQAVNRELRQVLHQSGGMMDLNTISSRLLSWFPQAMVAADTLANAIVSHESGTKMQVYFASTQTALFSRSQNHLTSVLEGGLVAALAMDSLTRDALQLEQIQKLLREGDESGNSKLDPALHDGLAQLESITASYRGDLEIFVPQAESWIDMNSRIDNQSFEIMTFIDDISSRVRYCDN